MALTSDAPECKYSAGLRPVARPDNSGVHYGQLHRITELQKEFNRLEWAVYR